MVFSFSEYLPSTSRADYILNIFLLKIKHELLLRIVEWYAHIINYRLQR